VEGQCRSQLCKAETLLIRQLTREFSFVPPGRRASWDVSPRGAGVTLHHPERDMFRILRRRPGAALGHGHGDGRPMCHQAGRAFRDLFMKHAPMGLRVLQALRWIVRTTGLRIMEMATFGRAAGLCRASAHGQPDAAVPGLWVVSGRCRDARDCQSHGTTRKTVTGNQPLYPSAC